jgi:hypothetical protein
MMDDKQLLGAYARERSESAFGELLTRHIDFVYSAALRVASGDKRRPKPYRLLNQPRRRFVEISHRSRYWNGRPRNYRSLN